MGMRTVGWLSLVVGLLLTLTAPLAWGHEKKEAKAELSDTWTMQGGEMKIEYVDKESFKLHPHGDHPVIVILCSYQVDKKGLVKAKVTDFEGKETAKAQIREKLPAGSEFSFTWSLKDGVATLGEVKGEEATLLKSHLEGKYDQKK